MAEHGAIESVKTALVVKIFSARELGVDHFADRGSESETEAFLALAESALTRKRIA